MKSVKSAKLFLLSFVISLFFISCSKEKVEQGPEEEGDVALVFNIQGVADYEEESSGEKSAMIEKTGDDEVIEIERNVVQSEDLPFVAVASLTENPTIKSTKSKINPGNRFAATSTMMQSTIKYRILIFDNNDQFLTSIDAVAGTTPKWTGAFRNKTYKWKAYSYNTTSNITPAIPANPTAAQLTTTYTSSQDFLYDANTITTNNTQNYDNKVNILFKRQRAIVELVINTRGVFDRIKDINGTVTGIRQVAQGSFDLKNGTSTYSGTPVTSKVLTMSDFKNLYTSNDTIKTMYLYTLDNQTAITNYSVNLTNITFHTDLYKLAGRDRTFTQGLNFSFTKSFIPVKGKQYKIIIDLLTRTLPITDRLDNTNIANWAFSNLFYDSARKLYALRHYNNTYYNDVAQYSTVPLSADFFNWKAMTTDINAATGQDDPCKMLYPKGRWRMPTHKEFGTIINLTPSATTPPRRSNARNDTFTDPVRYIDIVLGLTPPNQDPYYYQNGMPLLQLGYRASGSSTYTNNSAGISGTAGVYYWTSNEASTTTAQYFYVTNTSNSGATMNISSTSSPLAGNKTAGLNIRCVEDRGVFNASNYTVDIK